MLSTILPHAIVLHAVWPHEHALAFLLIIEEVASVYSAIRPREHSVATHLVAYPLAVEGATIVPRVLAPPLDLI